VSVSGCRIHCAQPDINDVGVFGAERIIEGKREAGFGLKVGGGLSTRPYFAADLGVFLRYDQVFPTVREIAAIFRDSEVLRQDRSRARLKFLLHDPKIGIGPERFRKLLEERLGYRLDDVGAQAIPEHTEVDHLGIRAQKQPGKFYLGIGVPAGRLSGDALFRLADIADEFSTDATVRNTNKQNFLITSIPGERLEFLKAKVRAAGFDFEPSVFRRAIVSCTGIEFCNLAVTETKEVARNAANDLEKRFPGAQKNVRIHFSGCPNNCGQNSIADIGLRGGLTKIAGKPVEVFDILLGGTTGAKRAFAETTSRKIPGAHVTDAIANLYEAFLAWSKNGGIFHDFVKSHTAEELDGIARKGLPAPPPTGIQPPLGP
jgi:sulfite reductase beta subunit-like hemoprotein